MKDVAAERAVIAGVCALGRDAYDDICDIVTSQTFTVDSNQMIWACLEHTLKSGEQTQIDLPSILSAAKAIGVADFFNSSDEKQHLRAVMNFPVRPENVRKFAGKIRKLEIARLFDAQLGEAKKSLGELTGDESVEQIMAMAEQPIFDLSSLLTNTQNFGTQLMGDGAVDYVQYLMDNPREMMGIPTGIRAYDRAIGGGLRENSMDIIAARMKQGKTMLVDNIALNIAGPQNVPVLNLDTEMTREEHIHRVVANLAGVNTEDIETGKCGLKNLDRKKVLDAAEKLRSMPYHYQCVIGMSFEDMLASMRRWVTRTVGIDPQTGKVKPCVIIYDYLKLMSADILSNDMKEYQALGFIATALKNFVGRYATRCLTFAQLNREGVDREDSTVISGSDRILMYGTSFSIYKWKTPEEKAELPPEARKYTHKLIPVFTRHGRGIQDGDYINIHSQYEQARVVEGPTAFELEKNKGLVQQQKGIVVNDTTSQPAVEFN